MRGPLPRRLEVERFAYREHHIDVTGGSTDRRSFAACGRMTEDIPYRHVWLNPLVLPAAAGSLGAGCSDFRRVLMVFGGGQIGSLRSSPHTCPGGRSP